MTGTHQHDGIVARTFHDLSRRILVPSGQCCIFMVAVSQADTGRGCIGRTTTPMGLNRLSEWAHNEQA
jgi:hypothetical protein